MTLFDVLIIGSGPAGLSVATGLARQLHTAVVFDSGVYRNACATHMHNVLGWDHINPAKLREKGKQDLLARYSTIQFEGTAVNTVRRINDKASNSSSLFEAVDAAGQSWYGRKLVLATGVKDVPADIPGFDECWGRGIFHCLFCDGYEERGQRTVGILATGEQTKASITMHITRMALRLSESVRIYTHGNEEFATALRVEVEVSCLNAVIDNRRIAWLEKGEEGAKVRVYVESEEESKVIEEGFLVYGPSTEVNGPFATQLDLKMTAQGDIEVSQPFFEASEPGVFAVGDVAGPIKAVTPAVYSGTLAAGGIAMQLQAENPPVLEK
ncbi:hypothetical protein BJX99DRAFT_260964 [Aspergillus californicus]